MSILRKDPADVLDYGFDFKDWLKQYDGTVDVISTATWTATPAGLTLEDEYTDSTIAGVWLSEGSAGKKYAVACKVTTAAGRVVERSFTVHVEER